MLSTAPSIVVPGRAVMATATSMRISATVPRTAVSRQRGSSTARMAAMLTATGGLTALMPTAMATRLAHVCREVARAHSTTNAAPVIAAGAHVSSNQFVQQRRVRHH